MMTKISASYCGRLVSCVLFLLLGLFLRVPSAGATPPETLELAYDQAAGVLIISGNHPTQDRLEHFIRRAVVIRNEDEPKKFYDTRQDSASSFKFTVPIKAEPGDHLQVEVYCSQGGGKTAELQIPKIVQEVKPAHMTAEDIKAIKDRDHQSLPVIP